MKKTIADRVAELRLFNHNEAADCLEALATAAALKEGPQREVTYVRGGEPGWKRIGLYDTARRRSLWIRVVGNVIGSSEAIELCSGREGDDAYVRLTPSDPQWQSLCNLLLRVEGDCGVPVPGEPEGT